MNYTNIRYGKMLLVGRFKTDRQDLHKRDRCIVRTDRGKEVGEVLSPLEAVPETLPPESLWDVLRRASPEDLQHAERLEKESIPRAVKACKEFIVKLNLPMKLVDVDYVFGGERVIFYFTSETRVDFRELVRMLAHEFRTRIELKQVGARDEARLVGDCGHCGLTLCCRGHLKELGGINMDMAKIQKHTADPSKITGRCGKLLCCLRYEYTTYTESRDVLPAKGTRLETQAGTGVVVEQNMLLREVTIEKEGADRVVVKLEEILGAPKSVAGCTGCGDPKAGEAPASADAAAGKPPPAAAAQAEPPGAKAAEGKIFDTTRRIDVQKMESETKNLPVVTSEPMWVPIAKAGEFAPGAGRVVDLGGLAVAVYNVDGQLHVLANQCPHQGGPLGNGKLEGTSVTCPWHQWKFDVTSGKCLSVSGSHARAYEAKVDGEDLYIKV